MKKNTVLRNESRHAVKMEAGSNVAERKSRKPASANEPVVNVPVNVQAIAPLVATPAPAPAKTAPRPAAKPRAKARLNPSHEVASPPVREALPTPKTPAAPPPPVLDEAALWEKDSPVKNRLAQLRTRNALLGEQLQRLKSPSPARGKNP
jgi:hypothetical protein